MTLRPRLTRRRSGKLEIARPILGTLRSLATVPIALRLFRRRRTLALALRRSSVGLALAGALAALGLWRRRRARTAESLPPGPPNESAPGHHIPAPQESGLAPVAGATAPAPNESAPGHRPSPEGDGIGPPARQPMG